MISNTTVEQLLGSEKEIRLYRHESAVYYVLYRHESAVYYVFMYLNQNLYSKSTLNGIDHNLKSI